MVMGSDTVLIFSLDQGKEITRRNEERKEYMRLSDLCEQQRSSDSIKIFTLEGKVLDLTQISDGYVIIIRNKDELLNICESEKAYMQKQIRRQKIAKWCAIGGAVAIGVIGIIY